MTKAKILYDTQIFDIIAFGGIPRYYTEVLKGVNKNNEFSAHLGSNFIKNKEIQALFNFPKTNNLVNSLNLPSFGRIKNSLRRSNEKRVIHELKSGKYNIFHPSFYNPAYLDHLGSTKLVITIHDMIPELYPNQRGYKEMAKNKAALIRKAHHIITVSSNTKKDLLHFFPEINEKIVTRIYLGCDIEHQEINNQTNKTNYLLYVGSREGYKNFDFLIDALSAVLNKDLLLYTSGSPYTPKEMEKMKKAGIIDFVQRKFVSDEELAILYAEAKALLFPSEYEGFGLPIVEALKNNCPIILTQCSCFPEIAGEAGIYFENKNKDSFIEALSKLENKEFIANKISEGQKRLQYFSWKKNVEETEKCYKIVLQEKK